MEEIDIQELYNLTMSAVSRSKQKVYREFEDTVQEAMMFLVNNMKYYDKEKGSLSTFVYTNVKRSMFNQVVYLNAKRRKENWSLISLELPTTEDHTISDNLPSSTNVEYEVMWSNLMDKLDPLEQDILRFWAGKNTRGPLDRKHNIPQYVLSHRKTQLKKRLRDELLINFDIMEIGEADEKIR